MVGDESVSLGWVVESCSVGSLGRTEAEGVDLEGGAKMRVRGVKMGIGAKELSRYSLDSFNVVVFLDDSQGHACPSARRRGPSWS